MPNDNEVTPSAIGHWWITTDVLARGGTKVLGPFETQELALDVRTFVELVPIFRRPEGPARHQETFWVDEDESHG